MFPEDLYPSQPQSVLLWLFERTEDTNDKIGAFGRAFVTMRGAQAAAAEAEPGLLTHRRRPQKPRSKIWDGKGVAWGGSVKELVHAEPPSPGEIPCRGGHRTHGDR